MSGPSTRIIARYDQHLYPWYEDKPESNGDAAPRQSSPPSYQLFNIDSVECTLKALDLAREQPFAFAFPRADDETRLPRTDDGASPDVATNFETTDLAVKFINSVCRGHSSRFRFCEELLAYDTPRKRSVQVSIASALSPGDRKAAFMAFLPAVIAGFMGEGPFDWAAICLRFGVSEVISCKGETSSSYLVVRGRVAPSLDLLVLETTLRGGGAAAVYKEARSASPSSPTKFRCRTLGRRRAAGAPKRQKPKSTIQTLLLPCSTQPLQAAELFRCFEHQR